MRVALYARVSTESQQARGTIGSQLAVLRERVGAEGDEVVAEFCDDGHSGARLDRPGLDALRDAAEAGLIERVWCLSPDRLARVYAYQVIVLDELARHGVRVRFTDAPPLDDDPQAKLLTQVQGVIAEYERAKIAERYRRGKLFRSRAGEVLAWRTPYGYRRQPRDAHGPARLEVFEPEAAVVRRIFDDYVHGGHSLREIIRRLAADQIPPPTGRDRLWRTSTLSKLLRNEAYIGRIYVNRTEAVPDPRPGQAQQAGPPPPRGLDHHRGARHRRRPDLRGGRASQPRQQPVEPTPGRTRPMAAAWPGQVRGLRRRHELPQEARPQRHLEPLLPLPQPRPDQSRRGRPALPRTQHPLRRPRHVRVRPGPRRPAAPRRAHRRRTGPRRAHPHPRRRTARRRAGPPGPQARRHRRRTPPPHRPLPGRPPRATRAATPRRRRRAPPPRPRPNAATPSPRNATSSPATTSCATASVDFASRVLDVIDTLDFDQKQTLLRLVVEEVHVTGWHVQIRLRIPLDDNPDGPPRPPNPDPGPDRPGPVSTEDRLRSLGSGDDPAVQQPVQDRGGHHGVGEAVGPGGDPGVAGDDHAAFQVALARSPGTARRWRRRPGGGSRTRRSPTVGVRRRSAACALQRPSRAALVQRAARSSAVVK